MAENKRDPMTCGQSLGFDGVFVCRLCLLPCERVRQCPKETTSNRNREEESK